MSAVPQRILVRGDHVVSLGAQAVVVDGAVVVEGGRISAVGPRVELEQHGPFDRELGGPGHLVMPGFVNAHFHSECWTSRGLVGTIFELSNLFLGAGPPLVDAEAQELLATWGLVQALRGGQTTTVDVFYGKPRMPLLGAEPVLRAYERVGLRTAFALSLRDQNRYAHEPDDQFLARLPAELADEVRDSPLGYAWPLDEVFAVHGALSGQWGGRDERIRIHLAPDWTPACSDELLRRARRVADETGAGLTTHVLETRSELAWNIETYGVTAVSRLADLGYLGDDVTFSHFVWATDDDIAVAADHGVTVASNPGSNLRLSSGICRVRDLLAAGVPVAFGTDGISFSDREDFFAELRLASYLQRQPDVFAEHRLDSEQLLRSAGTAGSRAAGWPGRLGRLVPGAFADLLVLRSDRLFFPPGRYRDVPLLDVLVDRASPSDLRSVLVNGRLVLDEGRVITVDEDRLADRIAALAERLYPEAPESRRWLTLANAMVPHAQAIYDRWYGEAVEAPAAVYNTRRPPALADTGRSHRAAAGTTGAEVTPARS